ncbi:Ig-like domain-containing protein [Flavobacterium capsici]|uniref:Ig-like domain-containing protein n=1 Tax=Flavobacterium capsici TaxID=3075618 RepID=A0AA96J544_9FLAO|nr:MULTISPECIES: hypothetical protein [unclassified Flavobacterium]WNM18536.1 hypothetical protein RN608_11000 [Flavobacterium sp. PMR2A8]WNM22587.1 hypothetical protein RN605_04300 [Flavobacterium sp. PMTSA4]
MKKIALYFLLFFVWTFSSHAQCTISGSPINSGTLNPTLCTSFVGCTTVYIGDGINPTTLVMTANFDLTCLGSIQFIVRNNANIDFSTGNYDLTLAANSSIVIEAGGSIGAGSNCSASDLIKIGTIKVASCNGGGGAETDFPGLISGGGYNTVNATATAICGSGSSIITAQKNPVPTSSTTYKFYTVASGGSPVFSSTVSSSPYVATYTTPTLSTSTTYYVEATTGSVTTPRRAVSVSVVSLPSAPAVTISHPTCSTATGIITINTPTGSGMTYSINGSTYANTSGVFNNVASANYNVTAKNSSGCISAITIATVNTQPVSPVQPLINSITQPDCTSTLGSFVISNYNASYSYAISPSTGVTRSGNTVTAPAGSYNVTATLSSCSSIPSATITINSQRVNTWNGTSWSLGIPSSLDRIVFNGNYSSLSNVVGCACTVNSGNVVFNSGNSLIITNEVTVSGGSLTFENDASLVQINNSSVNSGSIIYKRRTTPLKQYDYTYWSSPVANASLSQLATNSLFYSFDPNINNWVYQASGAIMAQGKGYIGRAPSGLNYAASNQQVVTNFNGVPNNGIINPTIVKSATSGHNLIGNPYSSAIDIDLFLTNSTNDAIFNSTIYLWTHNTAITNNVYTADDYAKYNLTGGVKTASAASTGGATPTGKVAAGQGFFIEAKSSLANGNYSARFDNSMRISGNNNQFFRTASPEKHRFWVSINSPQGAFNEMLVGYVEGATNDFDSKYDGKTMQTNNSVFIAMPLNDLSLAIQAKALPFSSQDIIPFIYSTTINGTLSINLENFDGLFSNQDIYLLDKFTNAYHNLKDSNYTFTTSSGTFNNRFEIRFISNALGVTNPNSTENSIKIISNNNSLLVLSSNEKIEKVVIYDLLGKLVYATLNDLDRNEFNTGELNISPQVLLVKVLLSNGVIVSQKAIIK